MFRNPFSKSLALTIALLLLCAAHHSAKPQPIQQSGTAQTSCSDEAILNDIKASLHKAFPSPKSRKELLLFNVTVTDGVVTLQGGVQGATLYVKVLKAVKSVKSLSCIKAIDVKGFQPFRGGNCDDATQQECNGTCIGKNQTCNEIG